jgi:hypothetical protein
MKSGWKATREAQRFVFLAAIVLVVHHDVTADDNKTDYISVKAADIHSGRAKIIGLLGRPMGEVVTIHVERYAPAGFPKASNPRYRVTRIDGKAVDPPIEFEPYWLSAVTQDGRSAAKEKVRWDWKAYYGGKLRPPRILAGELWEVEGVEACRTHISVAQWDERGPIVQEAPGPGAAGFDMTFEFFAARRISGRNQSPTSPEQTPSAKPQ